MLIWLFLIQISSAIGSQILSLMRSTAIASILISKNYGWGVWKTATHENCVTNFYFFLLPTFLGGPIEQLHKFTHTLFLSQFFFVFCFFFTNSAGFSLATLLREIFPDWRLFATSLGCFCWNYQYNAKPFVQFGG